MQVEYVYVKMQLKYKGALERHSACSIGSVKLMKQNSSEYGVGDNSYKMAGELPGITALVDAFYINMGSLPQASKIRDMHPEDLSESRTKLRYFLSGWLGGPKLYAKHYGSISIPFAHRHLAVTVEESEAWLLCMQKAIEAQAYAASFKVYLLVQLRVPAQRIVSVNASELM